jgi:hypothetical protein
MRAEWLKNCFELARRPALFFSGCRKILSGVRVDFGTWDNDLTISDCGFTKSKLTMLRRLYLHEESHAMAQELWTRRLGQDKYGSVGFTCYNHLIKADPTKQSKRASVMGPCIQSVTLTLMNDGSTVVDAFYRTTEFLKKFPADLVFLRDELLAPFKIDNLRSVRFHFANVTIHPMYMVTVLPLIDDPIDTLNSFREDKRFYDWTIKWTARYLCDEYSRGIMKFSQALRVRKDALNRLSSARLSSLQDYLRRNHPGYRNEYSNSEDEDDD